MKILLKILRFLLPKCPECSEGRLHRSFEDFVLKVSVWECDSCGRESLFKKRTEGCI